MEGLKPYMKPSDLMAANPMLRKLAVGQVINPAELGWAPHPVHGMLPTIRVKEITPDGRLQLATFTCVTGPCAAEVEVHSGDWFQKRHCHAHKGKHRGASKKLDPAVKIARAASRALEREQKKVAKAQKKVEDTVLSAQQALASTGGNPDLIKRVAAAHGVAISKDAILPPTKAEKHSHPQTV